LRSEEPVDVDLELTASFLVLVDEWHYGRAADALFLSASALTKRIQRLERQLGVRLVERGPEGMAGLTAAGMEFAGAARPLLQHALAAAQAARAASARGVLRVGVPAGAGSFLPPMGLDRVGDRVGRAFPTLRVALVEVPFPLVTRCLPEGQVDVLLTIAAVRHREVDSIPLPVTSARIGVISARHPLAGAGEEAVAQFCEHSLLHNPAIPDEWMRPFWLADVRPRAEARLTTTHASNNQRVLRDVLSGSAAMVTLSPERPSLSPGLEPVALVGAEPVTFYAARRRHDRRTVVLAYIELLQTLGPRSLQ
jgi:DNA-binding transcriptional LysR family regulator